MGSSGSEGVRDSEKRRDKDMENFLKSGTDILDRQIESHLKVIGNKIDFGGFERLVAGDSVASIREVRFE